MKKIISIILAAAMMLSLIPSVFATGEETPIKIVYNFKNKGVFGETETTYDLTKLSYAASNGFWAFGGSSAGDSVISDTPGVRYHNTKTLGGTNPPTISPYFLYVLQRAGLLDLKYKCSAYRSAKKRANKTTFTNRNKQT